MQVVHQSKCKLYTSRSAIVHQSRCNCALVEVQVEAGRGEFLNHKRRDELQFSSRSLLLLLSKVRRAVAVAEQNGSNSAARLKESSMRQLIMVNVPPSLDLSNACLTLLLLNL